MNTLRLADGSVSYPSLADAIEDNYINVPDPVSGQLIRIREDLFDNMPDSQFYELMDQLQPYNAPGVNGLGSWLKKRAEKREARKEEKAARKDAKFQARQENKAARRDTIKNIAQSIGGMITGGGSSSSDQTRMGLPVTGSIDFGAPEPEPWYKKPAVIIGGLALLGGGIYLATRKRKK